VASVADPGDDGRRIGPQGPASPATIYRPTPMRGFVFHLSTSSM